MMHYIVYGKCIIIMVPYPETPVLLSKVDQHGLELGDWTVDSFTVPCSHSLQLTAYASVNCFI